MGGLIAWHWKPRVGDRFQLMESPKMCVFAISFDPSSSILFVILYALGWWISLFRISTYVFLIKFRSENSNKMFEYVPIRIPYKFAQFFKSIISTTISKPYSVTDLILMVVALSRECLILYRGTWLGNDFLYV